MVHFWDCGVVFGVVSERKPKIKGICRGAVIGAKKGGTKMSRLVLKMPYVKGGGHASNNVKYIATREGVDKSINFNINGQHKKNNIEYISVAPSAQHWSLLSKALRAVLLLQASTNRLKLLRCLKFLLLGSSWIMISLSESERK